MVTPITGDPGQTCWLLTWRNQAGPGLEGLPILAVSWESKSRRCFPSKAHASAPVSRLDPKAIQEEGQTKVADRERRQSVHIPKLQPSPALHQNTRGKLNSGNCAKTCSSHLPLGHLGEEVSAGPLASSSAKTLGKQKDFFIMKTPLP